MMPRETARSEAGGGWWRQAACRSADPDLFFPVSAGAEQVAAAVAVCGTCGVRADCLAYALTTRQDFGVWGGRTEEERRGRQTLVSRAAGPAAARGRPAAR